MALTIGRVGTDGNTLGEGFTWSQQGDQVTIGSAIRNASSEDAMYQRDQLLGLLGNDDEPQVTVTSSSYSQLNGYYRVVDVQIAADRGSFGTRVIPFTVQLQRVRDWQAPLIESRVIYGGPLTNGHTYTDSATVHWIPNTYYSYGSLDAPGGALWAANGTAFTSSDGTMTYGQPGASLSSTVYQANVQWALPIADFYRGAARIETDGFADPTTFRTVVGRQMPALPTKWRLNNGFLRVVPGTTAGSIAVAAYNGTSWSSVKLFQVSGTIHTGLINAFKQVSILRNSVEEVAIRLWCSTASAGTSRIVTLDLSLPRGSTIVRGAVSISDVLNFETWRVQRDSAEAATSITGGIRATANDASGNRYVILSDYGTTKDTTNGRVTDSTNRQTLRFACGFEVAGSSAVFPQNATGAQTEFFGQMSESMRVAAR